MASLLLGGPPMASQALYPNLSSKSQSLINLPSSYSPPATSPSSPALLIYCGRGDRKTAKGKRFNHSYGNSRPRNKNKGRGPPRVFAPPLPPRKDKYDDGQIIEIELDDDILDN